MFQILGLNTEQDRTVPQEGELYKVIHSHGKTFEIRYGFYEERDRHNPFGEPVEIYPNFIAQPLYTDEGIPFATAIQSACERFHGKKDENSSCEDCSFYRQVEELLGICTCPNNQKPRI